MALAYRVCMSRWKKAFIGLVVVVGTLAVVGFFALPAFLGLDAEGPVELSIGDRAEESIALIFAEPGEGVEASLTEAEEVVVGSDLESVEGVWRIAGDSVAGYRVFKDFVGASEFEAVGRTSSIFGELEIEDTTVTSAQFAVDVATIRSDDDRRDVAFRGEALNAVLFPFANFRLTSSIELGDVPQSGEEVNVDVTGEVTLKGVTNEVVFPLTARLVGDEVQVAGSIDVVFSDYEITPPRTPVIIVRDVGVIEFSLFFEQDDIS